MQRRVMGTSFVFMICLSRRLFLCRSESPIVQVVDGRISLATSVCAFWNYLLYSVLPTGCVSTSRRWMQIKISLDEEEFIAPIGSMRLNRAIIVSALLVDSKHVDNES